jgi:L-lactate dehydrogenase complex protein LldG
MSKARQEILKQLSSKGQKTSMPAIWVSKNQFDDPISQFAQALRKVKGEVHQASDLDTARIILVEILNELNVQKIVVAGNDTLRKYDLSGLDGSRQWFIVGKSKGNLRSFCATADVGLTGADIALAETGSVILKMNAGQSRLVSLLPPVHIVMLPTSKIVPDIFSWMSNRMGDMPSQLVIISGPSKTADIEQTLVIGVHGPKRLIVILYDD